MSEIFGADATTPILGLIDIQREYVTKGRPFNLDGIEPSLENCRSILEHAREAAWPVAHVRHLGATHLFNEATEWSRFVEGFEPLANEMIFTKRKLSCFSNDDFARMMETARANPVYIIGYNAQMCCLSTVVDAHHRGMRLKFVRDASWARATQRGSEAEVYPWIADTIGIYADLVDAAAVLGDARGVTRRRRLSSAAAE
jgi:nicotinamidase-related amidase